MVLFVIVIIVLLLFILVMKEIPEPEQRNNLNNNLSYDYIVKKNPMTETELKFYRQLKTITDKYNLIIMPQVQTQAIFEAKYKQQHYQTAKNKIIAKSIDFAIVDQNYNYKIFIELDDYKHKYKVERDNFINDIFNKYNLKLYRIKPSNNYDLESLEKIINEII